VAHLCNIAFRKPDTSHLTTKCSGVLRVRQLAGCLVHDRWLCPDDRAAARKGLGPRTERSKKPASALLPRDIKAGILLSEHLAQDGATACAHACRLGAEGIVSKRIDGTYRSGRWPGPDQKVRNLASVAVQRERSEKWNR
jgi:hypothetical protein